MKTTDLGPLRGVSQLTLGGGGLGGVWGERSPDEAIATVRAAVDAGINLIDLAPIYGTSEALVAGAFEGRPPADLRFTSKCYLASPRDGVRQRLLDSLETTL